MSGTRFTDIRRFDSIDSTNRYLLGEARLGAPEGVVAVAEYQSAGRGRLGRQWQAPAGSNLLVSVLLRPDLPADHRHLASAVVALAAADGVEATCGLVVGIKWPNDLLAADGRKVAGILAEADLTVPGGTPGSAGAPGAGSVGIGAPAPSAGPSAAPIVVGIGLNVDWPRSGEDLAPELAGSATSLWQEVGRSVDRSQLLDALLEALEPRVADLADQAGRARQAADFRARCTTLGHPVRVELADGSFEGVATDVTGQGHLVVETDGTARTVVSGDVVHLRTTG
jgi:BirA family transcriptional regulator, biotin operon repressor / biotin---[acetyl-CoA-carboxylase] ligase